MEHPKVILKSRRASVLETYRHPWVFSKGLASKPDLPAGTLVRVLSQDSRHLGWAFYHPHNAISLRMVSFDSAPVTEETWKTRLASAHALRKTTLPARRSNFRLIHGENDGFPGLTVDLYGEVATMQVNSAGFESIKEKVAKWIVEETTATAVYERSEGWARKQEGLPNSTGFLVGEISFPYLLEEHGFQQLLNPQGDQKTGLYLDQYPQREWVEAHAKDKTVLDLCSYTGAFTMAALRGGAEHVTSLDTSSRALETLAKNLERNDLPHDKQTSIETDVFKYLKNSEGKTYDMVILDPPALAKQVRAVEKTRNAYRHINRDAARFVKEGGMLLTFSCTGVINTDVFGQSVFLGMRDAKRSARIVDRFGPGGDHPVDLCFPEGNYLKGLALFLA